MRSYNIYIYRAGKYTGRGGRYGYVYKANTDNTLVKLQPKRSVNP